MTVTTDRALLDRAAAGDAPAFAALYERHSVRLGRYLERMVGADKAADFLQEVFLRLLDEMAVWPATRPVGTWLFAVAHNLCCNEYRHMAVRRRAAPLPPRPGQDDAPGAQRRLEEAAFRQALEAELEQLDNQRRSIFLLRFQEEFALTDIARVMGCPIGTVKSRLFHTVRLLAERLQAYDPCLDEDRCHG